MAFLAEAILQVLQRAFHQKYGHGTYIFVFAAADASSILSMDSGGLPSRQRLACSGTCCGGLGGKEGSTGFGGKEGSLGLALQPGACTFVL